MDKLAFSAVDPTKPSAKKNPCTAQVKVFPLAPYVPKDPFPAASSVVVGKLEKIQAMELEVRNHEERFRIRHGVHSMILSSFQRSLLIPQQQQWTLLVMGRSFC